MRIPVVVSKIIQETPHVKRFTLKPQLDQSLPRFHPGAHILTYLHSGSECFVRSYSLTNCPSHDYYEIAILKKVRGSGGSSCWHEHVKRGQTLTISYPRNFLHPDLSAKHHVFYAGGIGITPFLSMMRWCRKRGASFELHYSAKTKHDCAFYEYINREHPDQTTFYFTREGERIDPGLVKQHRIGTHLYICGPESFQNEIKTAALHTGYPKGSVHLESFVQLHSDGFNNPFTARLEEKIINVNQEDTLLDALNKEGAGIPFSCRMGQCGTCEVAVKKGDIVHRDSFLTEEERCSRMLPCVSRGEGVIEISMK
ncbi:PDR/VanB family oxidoreductase [Alteribacter keqinensis]|uniref:Oxidoreductase n=1 Tax=Alteribacter keqinensis TaxID=2483800 RepID=A0A3M7TV25_9BACI|nr:PDR/VanB family oxidoreductase [Alteribacter keqinensis]RNA69303.1 oxidoreductase [Alteribacter keqinensis]